MKTGNKILIRLVFIFLLGMNIITCKAWGYDEYLSAITGGASGATTVTPLPPLKTYQTLCYDSTGALDPLAPYSTNCLGSTTATSVGQDAQLQLGRVANFTGPTLVGAADYITKDNTTGLIWKTCTEGLSGATCATGGLAATGCTTNAGAAATCAWANPMPACAALNTAAYAGRTTWRLPTVEELMTLINYSLAAGPATFVANFPATVANNYWSSSTYVPGTTNAWYVFFFNGSVFYNVKPVGYYVRCVSSGP